MTVPHEVEDDRPIVLVAMEGSQLLVSLLAALDAEYRSITCAASVAALRQSQLLADVIVIDADADPRGVAPTCRRIRASWPAAIVAVGSTTSETDVAQALDAGADDYVAAPFGGELVARIRALLRRAPPGAGARIVAGPLTIDPARHVAQLAGGELTLSGTEFTLLAMLAVQRDRVVPREDLLARIGVADGDGTRRLLRVAMSRLRTKLRAGSPEGIGIDAVAGVGYQLVVRGAS